MRYEIGQEIIAVASLHTSKVAEGPDPLIPWYYDQIMATDVVKLTVGEHIKVRQVDHNLKAQLKFEEKDKNCDYQFDTFDGYILFDKEDHAWFNQYPHFIDDGNCLALNRSWKFVPSDGTMNPRFCDVLWMLTIYSDAIEHYEMKNYMSEEEVREYDVLCQYFTKFKKIAEETSGKKVVNNPKGEELKFKLV